MGVVLARDVGVGVSAALARGIEVGVGVDASPASKPQASAVPPSITATNRSTLNFEMI
jgi:hypothetical protein